MTLDWEFAAIFDQPSRWALEPFPPYSLGIMGNAPIFVKAAERIVGSAGNWRFTLAASGRSALVHAIRRLEGAATLRFIGNAVR